MIDTPTNGRCSPLSPAVSGERVREMGGHMFSGRNIDLGAVLIASSGRLDEGESEGAEKVFERAAAPHPRPAKLGRPLPSPLKWQGRGKDGIEACIWN
jgi:hypothetical protein